MSKIPIHIYTGTLGSGKTTVLKYLLEQKIDQHLHVLVNEFGIAGVDQDVLSDSNSTTSLIHSGCICCTAEDDFESHLLKLYDQIERDQLDFQKLVIETTGLADPSNIISTIVHHPVLQHHFSVDFVVTIVDMKNAHQQYKNNPEFLKQITTADSLILTKADISSDEIYQKNKELIEELNPIAKKFEAFNGVVDQSFLDHSVSKPNWQGQKLTPSAKTLENTGIYSISFHFDQSINWAAFSMWLSLLLSTHGQNVFRVKGEIDVGDKGPVILNGVHDVIHPPIHMEDWPDESRTSFMVFIVKDIDPQKILDSLEAFQRYIGSEVSLTAYEEV